MDFFFDTGIFLGLDDKDEHYPSVNDFLRKYPKDANRYYSAKAVKKELDFKRRQFTRKGWSKAERRRIFQTIKVFIWQHIENFTYYEQENKEHPYFGLLYRDFYPIVVEDYFDATILANAFLWSCEECGLSNPTVVTTDNAHFYKPKEKFFEIANKHLNRTITLDIQCVWDC